MVGIRRPNRTSEQEGSERLPSCLDSFAPRTMGGFRNPSAHAQKVRPWTDEAGDARIPILRFLWVMSPEFSTDPKKARAFRQRNYFADFEGFNDRISSFINRAFEFSPGSSGKSSGSSEWMSYLIDAFAHQYGWSVDQILDSPIHRLLVLLRRIRERNSDRPVKFNSEGDRLRQEFMDRANENFQKEVDKN